MDYTARPGCMHHFVTVQIISVFQPLVLLCTRREGEHFSKAGTGFGRAGAEYLVVGVGGAQLKVWKGKSWPQSFTLASSLPFPEVNRRSVMKSAPKIKYPKTM